jgi:hypothetical protein
VIAAAGVAAIKIGITANIAVRLADLQIGNHTKLKVTRLFRLPATIDAAKLERAVHKKLRHARTHGEWFRSTVAAAVDAILRGAQDLDISVELVRSTRNRCRPSMVPPSSKWDTQVEISLLDQALTR